MIDHDNAIQGSKSAVPIVRNRAAAPGHGRGLGRGIRPRRASGGGRGRGMGASPAASASGGTGVGAIAGGGPGPGVGRGRGGQSAAGIPGEAGSPGTGGTPGGGGPGAAGIPSPGEIPGGDSFGMVEIPGMARAGGPGTGTGTGTGAVSGAGRIPGTGTMGDLQQIGGASGPASPGQKASARADALGSTGPGSGAWGSSASGRSAPGSAGSGRSAPGSAGSGSSAWGPAGSASSAWGSSDWGSGGSGAGGGPGAGGGRGAGGPGAGGGRGAGGSGTGGRGAGGPGTGGRGAGGAGGGGVRAGAGSSGKHPGRTGSALALKNWRMRWRLFALIMIPILTAAAFGGVRVASAAGAANTARHIEQLAIVGGDVTQLAQAIENERDVTAGFIAAGHPARGQASLHKQYARTDSAARTVQARAARIGGGYSTDTRQRLSTVLARIRDLQGLRAAALRSQLPPLPMITDYSQVITDLFAFNDGIAEGSSDPQLADSVRALGFLSRTKDQASVQRAVLYAALTTGRFQPGGIDALTAAQAQQAADMATYLASATPAQRQLYMSTVTGPLVDQAQNIEQHAITQADSNLPLVTGNSATASRQWYTAMSDTIQRMHSIEREAVSSIIAHSRELRHGADRSALLTGVVMACVLIFSLIMTAIVARSLTRPLRRLRAGALQVAGARLPERVRQLSETGGGRDSLDVEPIEVFSTDEVGQVARAFDQVHREALRLAVNEASLRENINAMFVSLSRRSQSLVERQIRLIDELEQGEQDAERLGNLFRMDHLATRMRRNSENLLVLAGHEPTRRWGKPVALVDVMRAAVSEIEQYERITLSIQPGTSVVGNAVNDVVHLLAELLENATSFSPGDTPVKVTGHLLGSGGELLDITDQGVGMGSEEMAHANWRLENPPVVDVAVSRRMGLFVVARLAARHGIRVRLRQPELGGLTALIWLPDTLIAQDTTASTAWMRRLGAPGTEGLSGGGEAWSTPPSQAMFNAPAMPTSTMPTSTWTGPSRLADIEPMPTADSAPSYPADTAPPYAAETETAAAGSGPTYPADTGPMRASDTGPMRASDTGPMQAAETGSTQAADTGPMQAADTGSMQAGDTGSMQAADTGSMQASDADPMQASDTGPMPAADAGPTRAADTGSMQAADASSAQAADVGPMPTADAGRARAADTGPLQAADLGTFPAAETSPLQSTGVGPARPSGAAPSPSGRSVVVPAGATDGSHSRLPIYDSLESDWFHRRGRAPRDAEEPFDTEPGAASLPEWTSAADEGWRAASDASAPTVGAVTSAGLPRRVPQANIVPGSASARVQAVANAAISAEATRDRMASFQEGVRKARAAIKTENPPEEG